MKIIPKLLTVCVLGLFSTAVIAKDISGSYECKGYDPFAKINYGGPMTVKKTDQTYAFEWNYGKKMQYHGTGLFNPHEDSIIGVVFFNKNEPKYTGVQIYKVHSNGTLDGDWTIEGEKEVGTEICIKK